VNAVDVMLAIQAKLHITSADHAKTVMLRQLVSTDQHIDQLVYQLYELNDDEIRVVEESVA